MSVLGPTDPLWVVQAKERSRYEEQFKSLRPENGVVTGEQAKGFFLQSQLPPNILGQIWALSDTDSDGRMNINEFSIACKLINLTLRGYQIPSVLPPALCNLETQFSSAGIKLEPGSISSTPSQPVTSLESQNVQGFVTSQSNLIKTCSPTPGLLPLDSMTNVVSIPMTQTISGSVQLPQIVGGVKSVTQSPINQSTPVTPAFPVAFPTQTITSQGANILPQAPSVIPQASPVPQIMPKISQSTPVISTPGIPQVVTSQQSIISDGHNKFIDKGQPVDFQ